MQGKVENNKQRFFQRPILERFMTDLELLEFQRRYNEAKKIAIADQVLVREMKV